MRQSISFVIPAYNDESTIEKAVLGADETGRKLKVPYEIIAINDCSVDATHEKLESLQKKLKNLKYISHKRNKGYGQTIKELYMLGRNLWIFSIPGDLQIEAREVFKLWQHKDDFDMIIGYRKKRCDPLFRILQSKIYNNLLKLLFGLSINDVNSVRLVRSSIFKEIKLKSRSAFVDAELGIKAMSKGLKVTEMSINHKCGSGVGGGGNFKIIMPTIFDMLKFFILLRRRSRYNLGRG